MCKMKTSEQSGVFLLEKYMTTKYEVDDIVILTGKIRSIEIFKEGVYYVVGGGIDKDGLYYGVKMPYSITERRG